MLPDTDTRIKLQVFEGPLDLLLFLIRKHELNIYDIPIESVTRQYLDAIYAMEELQLEVAGEFFVMAATLMEIKSRLLLPKDRRPDAFDDDAEDDIDPRWELVHQLIEYRRFKEASRRLDQLAGHRQDMMERYVSRLGYDSSERPLSPVDRLELWTTFNQVLRRLAERLVVGEIHEEHITVADRMEYLLELLNERREFSFTGLFPGKTSLRSLIATFLAVLELARLSKLTLRQNEAFSDIICTASEIENGLENPPASDTLTV